MKKSILIAFVMAIVLFFYGLLASKTGHDHKNHSHTHAEHQH